LNCPECEYLLLVPSSVPDTIASIDTSKAPATEREDPAPKTLVTKDPKVVNPFGVASFVLGLLGLIVCWVPLVGAIALPFACIGLFLGGIGLLVSIVGGRAGTMWPWTGIVLSGMAFVVAVVNLAELREREQAAVAETRPLNLSPAVSSRGGDFGPGADTDSVEPVVVKDDPPAQPVRNFAPTSLPSTRTSYPAAEPGKAAGEVPPGDSLYDAMMREKAEREKGFAKTRADVQAEDDQEIEKQIARDEMSIARTRASTLLRSAQSLEKAGKTPGALSMYRDIVKRYPKTPEAEKAASRVKALDPSKTKRKE
jgi:hypothetical protein